MTVRLDTFPGPNGKRCAGYGVTREAITLVRYVGRKTQWVAETGPAHRKPAMRLAKGMTYMDALSVAFREAKAAIQ